MNGNTCYRAHMIQGKYLFSRDLAYEPLSIEDAEEEMKAKKKKGSHVRSLPPTYLASPRGAARALTCVVSTAATTSFS